MVDQYWNFRTAEDSINSQGLGDCTYVPLGVTIDKGMPQQYHTAPAFNESGGLGITTSCKDVKGALQFINDLLSKEVTILRSWGVEGEDYMVGDDGIFYRTKEMRDSSVNAEYKASHLCTYSYFPNYGGMCLDGINAATPKDQPTEFFESLSADVQECLAAYNARTYVEMLGSANVELSPWYPMWSFSGSLTTETPGGLAWTKMGEVKHEYLSKVVVSDDFDTAWKDYLKAYNACKPEDFLSEMQEEVYNRIQVATGKDVRPAK
jgi:putative aldouronate transport system substrate-binding protein